MTSAPEARFQADDNWKSGWEAFLNRQAERQNLGARKRRYRISLARPCLRKGASSRASTVQFPLVEWRQLHTCQMNFNSYLSLGRACDSRIRKFQKSGLFCTFCVACPSAGSWSLPAGLTSPTRQIRNFTARIHGLDTRSRVRSGPYRRHAERLNGPYRCHAF